MYFTPALLSALSLSAVTAMPINMMARSNEVGQVNKLMARSDNALALMRNGISLPFARSPAQLQAAVGQIQALAARSTDASSATGGLAGILEVMDCLLGTLLGQSTDSSCPADLQGATGAKTTGNARVAMASMLSQLSDALSKSSKELANSSKSRRDDGTTAAASSSDDTSMSASSTNDVLTLLSKLESIVQNVMNDLMTLGLANPSSNSTSTTDGSDDGGRESTGNDEDGASAAPSTIAPTATESAAPTDSVAPTESAAPTGSASPSDVAATPTGSAPSGADSAAPTSAAPTSTSIPANADSAAPSTATEVSGFGKNCPAPGTPNDGMYRPGCPGYGRRDLARRAAVAEAAGVDKKKRDLDASTLKDLLPALSTILEAMPDLIAAAGGNATSAASNSTSSTSSDAGNLGNSTVVANATAFAQSSSFKKVVTQIHQLVSAVNSNATTTTSTTSSSSASSSSSSSSSDKKSPASQAVQEIGSSGTGAQTAKESVAAASVSHGGRRAAAVVARDSQNINMDLVNDLFAEILSGKAGGKRRLASDA